METAGLRSVQKEKQNSWRPLVRLQPVGLPRMIVGASMIALSVLALAAPLTAGIWSLQLLSFFPFVIGLTELYTVVRDPIL